MSLFIWGLPASCYNSTYTKVYLAVHVMDWFKSITLVLMPHFHKRLFREAGCYQKADITSCERRISSLGTMIALTEKMRKTICGLFSLSEYQKRKKEKGINNFNCLNVISGNKLMCLFSCLHVMFEQTLTSNALHPHIILS